MTTQTSISFNSTFKDILKMDGPFERGAHVTLRSIKRDMEKTLDERCFQMGIPYVIQGWQDRPGWARDVFTVGNLGQQLHGQPVTCINQTTGEEVSMPVPNYRQYLGRCRGRNPSQHKIYAKDISCPPAWRAVVGNVLPSFLRSLGPNDLLANMPEDMVAETLLLYLGIGGTWTPAHFDQCATIAHSLMLYADKKSARLAEAEAIWFVVPPSHYAQAKAYWASLGKNLDLECYFASLEELARAPFPIYVLRQRVGDLVILPPRAVHQVVNLGGASIKFAWNRATAQSLHLAVHDVIPRYREICRPESYRVLLLVKNSIEFALDVLLAYDTRIEGIQRVPSQAAISYASRLHDRRHRSNFASDYRLLLSLYAYCLRHDAIMRGIFPDAKHRVVKPVKRDSSEPTRCDFCQTDIWNIQFICLGCPTNPEGHDICVECVGRGRGCQHHASQLQMVEVFPAKDRLLLWTQAAKAWNTSTRLARLRNDSFEVDLDLRAPATATDPFSAASVAYLRHVGPKLPSQNVACHRCGVTDRNAVHMKCQSPGCLHVFCEKCMYKHHGDKWHLVVANRATLWSCYACQGKCTCAACRAATPGVRRGRQPAPTPGFKWFASPDGFNKPAISDPPLE